ncbi:MAG: hypothetical protein KGI97_06035 [Alphaproteobacteria bacterium]|nr:hypothetical protein [Alphaproteobacteria bacterium]
MKARFAAITLMAFAAIAAMPFDASARAKRTARTVTSDRLLGRFGAWRAYAYDEGGQKVCYMVATQASKWTRLWHRHEPYLMITHRPVEASTDVFSYGAGIDLDRSRTATIRVGKTTFGLFSVHHTAWTRDPLTDHALAKALVNGSMAQTRAYAVVGKHIKRVADTFDLQGSAGAYRAIGKACGLPGFAPKKTVRKKHVWHKTKHHAPKTLHRKR